ncbi:hypothetical protein C8R43DRAFT_979363 [Mycena crocata]|nr:hypothetical protein C8R43DRAFT_979363 [Mycena crocata]
MLSGLLLALPVVYSVSLLFWHLLRRHLVAKNLGLLDIPHLRDSNRHPDQKIQGTAVICGGSIAGLLTARVCHDHFERVLVIEAEAWVASEEGRKVDGWDRKLPRSRVLQYASLQGCQSFLYTGLRSLFPNIESECQASRIMVVPANPRFNLSGQPLRVPYAALKSGLSKTMYISRAGLETLLRRLVLDHDSYPNVQFMTGSVIDVRPDSADHSRLSKVLVRTDTGVQELDAALVADCTGPARAGLKWLERHGYGYCAAYPAGKLPLDQLKISFAQKLRYSSIMFRISPEFHDRLPLSAELQNTGPIYTFLEGSVEKGRALFALTRPDGDQLLAFTGHHGTARLQPKNLAELKEYVHGLITVQPIPDWVFQILDMLEEVKESAAVSLVKVPPTTYIRYHQATNLPTNWIALGDSVMTLNPLSSEGCTMAFKGALSLNNVLRAARNQYGSALPPTFSTKFFMELFEKTDMAWQNTRLMDYAVPTTEPIPGESLSSGAYVRWYTKHLQHLAITVCIPVVFTSGLINERPTRTIKLGW